MTDAIRAFAEHVACTGHDAIPAPALTATKTFILDTIGVALAGSAEPWTANLAMCAATWGSSGESAVWGTGQRLPAPNAALVNAYQVHCLEFDCLHEGAVVHPMATVLPALFAHAERRGGVRGRDIVGAAALGIDVACRIGAASRAPMRFFRPAIAGAFGAVAALGKLERFAPDVLTNAFGILYGQISGTLQPHVEGSKLLGMQMAFNARAAITAVDLAARGLVGPQEVLEGEYGYFRLFEGAWDAEAAVRDMGWTWQVTRVAHKPFPSGRLTHGAVDGLLRLQRSHGFSAADVARVIVRVPPIVQRLVGRADIPDPAPAYAKLCLPFVAATALIRGWVDVPDFTGDRLGDGAVHALAARIAVEVARDRDENAVVPQTVAVVLKDGRRHELTLDSVLGHPDTPLSRDRQLDKFRRCWRYAARPLPEERIEKLIGLVDRLEFVDDIRQIIGMIVP